jgi:hypothetical protein
MRATTSVVQDRDHRPAALRTEEVGVVGDHGLVGEHPHHHIGVYVSGPAPDRRPWPNDPVPQFVWMITSDLRLWIPIRAEIDALHAERHRRLHPVPKDQRHLGLGWPTPDDAFGEGAARRAAMGN